MTVNGVSLAVERRGEGPAVLFVHGYPLDRTLWSHQVAHLEGCQRIAVDLRGFGLSDAPDLGYSLPTYADDLAALLDALQVDDVCCADCRWAGTWPSSSCVAIASGCEGSCSWTPARTRTRQRCAGRGTSRSPLRGTRGRRRSPRRW